MTLLKHTIKIASAFLCALSLITAGAVGDFGRVSAQIDEAAHLKEQGIKLFNAGRYSDAEPLFKRSLGMLEASYGLNHPYVAALLMYLARLYAEEGRYADAEPLLQQTLNIFEAALGPDHLNVANSLNDLGLLYQVQGRYAEAEPLYKRALAIVEKNLGLNDPTVAAALNSLAGLYDTQSRYSDAEPLFKRSLAIVETGLGPNHPNVAKSQNNLALLYYHVGRYADAERLFKRSMAIEQSALGHPEAATLNNLALLYDVQARYAETESLLRRSLAIEEKAGGPDHPKVAITLHNLAAFYQDRGRDDDAESLYKRALSIREKAFGPDHPGVALTLNNLAELYGKRSRNSDAELLFKRAITIQERALGSHHPDLAISLHNLAMLYGRLDRVTDAEPLLLRALAIREKALGPNHLNFANSLNNLAALYRNQGRRSDAESLYKRSLAIQEAALGSNHPNVAHSLNNLAALYDEQGRFADALRLIRRTVEIGLAERWVYFSVLKGAVGKSLVTDVDSVEESFFEVQQATSSAASNAINQLSVRFAAGNDQLLQLIRKDQDLFYEYERLDKLIIEAVSMEPVKRNAANERRIRDRLQAIIGERALIQADLDQRFPEFAALSKPKPLSVQETQAQLADDEALVVFDFDQRGYAWIITRTNVNWLELKITAKDVEAHVKTIRASVTDDAPPFDVEASYRLYQSIFGHFAEQIASKKRLSIVTNGALTSIPLQLLVAKDPAGKALKNVEWLARWHAITVLPSVASLKTLRGRTPIAAAKPMIAFADPVFSKSAKREARNKVAVRGMTSFVKGTEIDTSALAEFLPQLPSTRDEVQAIAKELKVNPSDIKLGLDATEAAVKSAKLDQYRIVYFATHGLVAGDLEKFAKGKVEPSLALSIPDKSTDFDDGLLSATEVAQLKLNADWVVLSACNTAAEDKPGAEALSGLARAFFYAGARSLLVSHWEIDDKATASLMTKIFLLMQDNPKLSHGEALQQAMLSIIDSATSDDDLNPRLWAPFVIIGEPGKPN